MRGPASTRGPASNRSFTVYVHEMNTRQRTKGGTYINTTVQLQQFRCYCGAILMYPFILGYLNRAKISWTMGDWGGGGPRGPPLNTPLVTNTVLNFWNKNSVMSTIQDWLTRRQFSILLQSLRIICSFTVFPSIRIGVLNTVHRSHSEVASMWSTVEN